MKRLSIFLVLGLLFGLVTLNSCQKDDTQQATSDDAVAAAISADAATSDGLTVATDEATTAKDDTESSCYTVEKDIDWVNRVGTIVITFNGECADSVYRSGTMTIVWDLGWRFDPEGKSLTITYDNFVRNDKIFNGTISMSLSVDTTDSVPVITAVYNNFSIQFDDSTSFVLSGTKYIKYVNFFDADRSNNELVINSEMQGTSREGYNFTSVGEDITVKFSCESRFPVSGTKTINVENGDTYLIDFGDGTCDKIYTVTVNGVTTTYDWDTVSGRADN